MAISLDEVCHHECHENTQEGQGQCQSCLTCAQCPLCSAYFKHSVSDRHITECSTGCTSGTIGMAVIDGEQGERG